MEKTKGIVMRTSKRVTAIYTEKGDFIEVPTPKEVPRVGDMIEVDIKRKRFPLRSQSWLKYTASVAVFLLVFGLATFNLLALPNMAVASVSLDVNKGIELLVNKDGKVIEVRDANGGSYMVEGLSLTGQDPYQAINLIIQKAVKSGDLKKSENLIFVRIIPLSKLFDSNLDDETLKSSIQTEMSRLNLSGNLIVGESNKDVREQAIEHGMSVNDHILYEHFQENGIVVQPETLRNGDPKRLLSEANMSVTDLFPGECTEIKSSVESTRNEGHIKNSAISINTNMGSNNNQDNDSMHSGEQSSSSMHDDKSYGTSEGKHKPSSNTTITTPQNPSSTLENESKESFENDPQHNSSTDTTISTPQSPSQQNHTSDSNSTNENHKENRGSEHNKE